MKIYKITFEYCDGKLWDFFYQFMDDAAAYEFVVNELDIGCVDKITFAIEDWLEEDGLI